ncbi:hypothetical protein K474DRAFT_1700269 [Panus rudis PR-1116 ss-1]|nr:hypothetical protein K474DRAFT_1700269 [Panus rudis PR-1116 ss-1]
MCLVSGRSFVSYKTLLELAMGGGARYPYPKEVWSPAGGWWSRPSNWKSNTAVAFAGIFVITYAAFVVGRDREVRWVESSRPLPTQFLAKQKDKEQGATELSEDIEFLLYLTTAAEPPAQVIEKRLSERLASLQSLFYYTRRKPAQNFCDIVVKYHCRTSRRDTNHSCFLHGTSGVFDVFGSAVGTNDVHLGMPVSWSTPVLFELPDDPEAPTSRNWNHHGLRRAPVQTGMIRRDDTSNLLEVCCFCKLRELESGWKTVSSADLFPDIRLPCNTHPTRCHRSVDKMNADPTWIFSEDS